MGLNLKLLGQIECRLSSKAKSGDRLTLSTRKAEVLLAYLALAPGIRHPRERLLNLLWSNRSEEQARNSLRQALSAIKKTLVSMDEMPLEIERTTVSLDADLIQVDALEFEQLAGETDIKSLTKAAKLYQGEFLEGITIRDAASQGWLAHERDRFKRLIVEILSNLGQLQISDKKYKLAIESAERLVEYDPLEESAWRLLMQAYAAKGNRNHALLAYKRCSETLKLELGVEPETQTNELRDEIRDGKQTPVAPKPQTSSPEKSPLKKPADKSLDPNENAILVMPFENLSNDSEQQYFSEGITEGVIVGLTNYPSLNILSRNYSNAIGQQNLTANEISDKYKVRYIIEGSVRKTPKKLRITTQLVNTESGKQIWGKRFDTDLEKIFDVEDELIRTIVSNIKGKMDISDEEIAYRKPAKDMDSYDLLMRGKYHLNKFNPENNLLSREALEKCIALDPDCEFAHNYLYRVNILDWLSGWTEPRQENFERARHHIEKAVELGPDESVILSSFAEFLLFDRDYDRCEDRAERAYRLNPDDIETLATLSSVHAGLGNVEIALEMADACRTLDPFHPWIDWVNGIAYYTGKRFQDALDTFKMMPNPSDEIEGWLAACYERLGQHTTAEKHLQKYVETVRKNMVTPPATLEDWHRLWQATSAAKHDYDSDYPFDALCDAGLEQYIEETAIPDNGDKIPAIVVLPFDNLSGDPSQEYFSDGITESVINNLSLFPDMLVKSRNASFAFKEQIKSIGEISKELDVDYVVEGSIRKSNDRIRVSVQLVAAQNGNQVWSGRFDSELKDIFDLEEELSRTIAGNVTGRIESDLQKIAISKRAGDHQAYDFLLEGLYHTQRFTAEDSIIALDKLNKCIGLEPSNSRAHAILSYNHTMIWLERWTMNHKKSFQLAREHVEKAIDLTPNSSVALTACTEQLIFSRKYDAAGATIDKEIKNNPGNPEALAQKALLSNMTGQYDSALGYAVKCMEIDPHHAWGHWQIAESQLNSEKYEDAIKTISGSNTTPHYLLAILSICYMKNGEAKKAREAIQRFLKGARESMKAFPSSRDEWYSYWRDNMPFEDTQIIDAQFEILENAGICELQPAAIDTSDLSIFPTIAVLPFKNLSNDPEQEYFSDGISESIIQGLGMFKGLIVKSSHTSFVYRDSNESILDIAEQLNVQYMVDGSVRKSGNRLRIAAQLIESSSGNQLWGKHYDSELEDIFDLEEELSQTIASTLRGRIDLDIQQSAARKPLSNLKSYDFYLRGIYHVHKFSPEDNKKGQTLLEQSIELDPDNANAHAYLAAVQYVNFNENWTVDRKAILPKGKYHIERALELDPENAFVHGFMSEYLYFAREFDRGDFHADKAIELNPTLPDGYAMKAWGLASARQFDSALDYADKCLKLDPQHAYAGWIVGEVYRDLGKFEKAIQVFRSLPHMPDSCLAQIAVCLAAMGDTQQAKIEMSKYQVLARQKMPAYPDSVAQWRSFFYDFLTYKYDEDFEKFFDLILKAGLCDYLEVNSDELPSIAVLPFENLSGDPEQEFFSDGITSDIISTLSHFRNMRVVALHSTYAYKERKATIAEIAAEQNTRYILEGRIRKSGKKVRVNTELIDSTTEEMCWSETYDRKLDDIFAVQDEITLSIATAMRIQLADGDKAREKAIKTKSLKAWEYTVRAGDLSDTYIRDNIVEARRLIHIAIEYDPEYGLAWSILGWINWQEAYISHMNAMEPLLEAAETAAEKSITLDPDNTSTLILQSFIVMMRKGDPEISITIARRAVEISPGNSEALGLCAYVHSYAGRPKEALDYYKTAVRLSPISPSWLSLVGGNIYQDLGKLEDAIALFLKSIADEPESPLTRFYLIDAYLVAGKPDKAKQIADEIRSLEHSMNISGVILFHSQDEEERQRFHNNLELMGFSEQRGSNDNAPDALPSIAVLPFENMSGDPEQAHFSNGIANDLVTILSRFRQIRVVSSYSTSVYKDRKAPIRQIADEQNVRYILDGSIRKSGKKIRVNVQLIDSRTGDNCWVEQYDRKLDDIFAVQDEITNNITIAMRVQLADGLSALDWARGTNNIKAWESCAIAAELQDSYIRKNVLEAQRLALKALALDPDYATAWIIKGWVHWQEAYTGWGESMEESLSLCHEAADKALEIDPQHPDALSLKGCAYVRSGEPILAIEFCENAIALSPGNSEVQALMAMTYVYAGEYQKSFSHFEQSIQLCPVYPNWYLLPGAHAYKQTGNITKAIEILNSAVDVEPESPLCRFYLVDALVASGDNAAAKRVASEIKSMDAEFGVSGLIRTYSYNKEIRDSFKSNLSAMGFTEQS